jgi:citrate synthase
VLGQAPGNELVLFAMARTVGLIAHASEQLPRARYVGPAPGRGSAS